MERPTRNPAGTRTLTFHWIKPSAAPGLAYHGNQAILMMCLAGGLIPDRDARDGVDAPMIVAQVAVMPRLFPPVHARARRDPVTQRGQADVVASVPL
ncbi:MAG: hypothetical protein HOV79_26970 [Hamadaea sp.]|nr:hypothetical protein [Hamadaea sp.]